MPRSTVTSKNLKTEDAPVDIGNVRGSETRPSAASDFAQTSFAQPSTREPQGHLV